MAQTRSGRTTTAKSNYRIPRKSNYRIPSKPDVKKSTAAVRKKFCSGEGRNVQGRKKGSQLQECKRGKSFSERITEDVATLHQDNGHSKYEPGTRTPCSISPTTPEPNS